MRRAVMLIVLGGALIGAGVGIAWLAIRGTPSSPADEFRADSFRLERVYVVTAHIPNPEVEKVLEAVTAAVPLEYGFYDQVAFLDARGWNSTGRVRGPRVGCKTRRVEARRRGSRSPSRATRRPSRRYLPSFVASTLMRNRSSTSTRRGGAGPRTGTRATRIGGGIRKASSRTELTIAAGGGLESCFRCRSRRSPQLMNSVFPSTTTKPPPPPRITR